MNNYSDRIDLGLAIAQACNPGKQLSLREIAAYCDCSHEVIARIERRALAKVRRALRQKSDLAEALRG